MPSLQIAQIEVSERGESNESKRGLVHVLHGDRLRPSIAAAANRFAEFGIQFDLEDFTKTKPLGTTRQGATTEKAMCRTK